MNNPTPAPLRTSSIRAASTETTAEQERRFAEQADQASVVRAGTLTERLLAYGVAYCKEQNLTPEELVFAGALYAVNLRETFPDGKQKFDQIAARAAEYYDKNA